MVRFVCVATALAVTGLQVHSTEANNSGFRGSGPIDCQVSNWTPFSDCNAAGYKTKTRYVLVEPLRGGLPCPVLVFTPHCSTSECWMGAWSEWVCDRSSGLKKRTRVIAPGGLQTDSMCPEKVERAGCDPTPCEINTLAEDAANPWGECKLKDGVWTKTKILGTKPALHGGKACSDASRIATAPCAKDCKWSATEYGEWTACDANNSKYHPFKILQEAAFGGQPCPPIEQRSDNAVCDVDCVTSAWVPGVCEKNTVTGIWGQLSTRTVTTPAQGKGTLCGALAKLEACASFDFDCKYTQVPGCTLNTDQNWVSLTVTTPAAIGGRPCPEAKSCDREKYCDPLADVNEKQACIAALAKSGPLIVDRMWTTLDSGKEGLKLWECLEQCQTSRYGCLGFVHGVDNGIDQCGWMIGPDFSTSVVPPELELQNLVSGKMLAPRPAVCTYSVEWSYPLGDLGEAFGATQDDCCDQCIANPKCKAFYHLWRSSTCQFLTSIAGRTPSAKWWGSGTVVARQG